MRLAPIIGLVLAAAASAAGSPLRPDDSPALRWVTPAVSAPGVTYGTFPSRAIGEDVSYHIYLPDAYAEQATARFPVVYWLHGSGGGLPGIRPLSSAFDAAIEAGQMPPALIVFVNGLPGGMYVDWKDGRAMVESMIVEDLIPMIDATYRTQATRTGRAFDGFSMGGYGAARLGFKHPRLVANVSLLGAGPLQRELTTTPRAGPRDREAILARVYAGDQDFFRDVSPWQWAGRYAKHPHPSLRVRQIIGDQDETYPYNAKFHSHLTRLGIVHEYTVLPGVRHDVMQLIRAAGDRFWSYYRDAFGSDSAKSDSAAR